MQWSIVQPFPGGGVGEGYPSPSAATQSSRARPMVQHEQLAEVEATEPRGAAVQSSEGVFDGSGGVRPWSSVYVRSDGWRQVVRPPYVIRSAMAGRMVDAGRSIRT